MSPGGRLGPATAECGRCVRLGHANLGTRLVPSPMPAGQPVRATAALRAHLPVFAVRDDILSSQVALTACPTGGTARDARWSWVGVLRERMAAPLDLIGGGGAGLGGESWESYRGVRLGSSTGECGRCVRLGHANLGTRLVPSPMPAGQPVRATAALRAHLPAFAVRDDILSSQVARTACPTGGTARDARWSWVGGCCRSGWPRA